MDEIIARFVNPMANNTRDIINFKVKYLFISIKELLPPPEKIEKLTDHWCFVVIIIIVLFSITRTGLRL